MDDLDMSLDDLAQKNKPQQQQRPQRPAGGSGGGRGGRPGGVARTASGTGPGDRSGTRSPYSRPPPASADAPWKHDMFGGARSNPGSGTHTPRSGGRYEADRPTDRPTARLRIENVHYEIQPFQLEKIFAQAGELVDKPNIIYDRAGRSTGLAFVTYSSVADATLAKDKLDGQRANGEPIRIHYVPVALPVKTEGRVDKLGRAVGPAVDNSGKPLLGRLGGILGSGGEEPKREYQRADRGGEREREPRGVGAHRGGAAPARGAGGAGGRGGGRGGNAAAGGRGGKREAREPRKAKTGDALDEELEAFMRAPPAEASAVKPSDAMEE